MKRVNKRVCSFLLVLLLFCCSFVGILEVGAYSSEEATIVSSASQTEKIRTQFNIPADEEILGTYSIPIQTSSKTRETDFILFSITRRAIYWTLIGAPNVNNWWFNGYLSITNLTHGHSDGSHMTMQGTSGVFGYPGYTGNMYMLQFHGDLIFNAHGISNLFEKCDGTWVWTVPYN